MRYFLIIKSPSHNKIWHFFVTHPTPFIVFYYWWVMLMTSFLPSNGRSIASLVLEPGLRPQCLSSGVTVINTYFRGKIDQSILLYQHLFSIDLDKIRTFHYLIMDSIVLLDETNNLFSTKFILYFSNCKECPSLESWTVLIK